MEADFSGYATKAGLKCSDGRTIMPEAFKHMDGKTVPLVWQHGHSEPANVLGHAVLEARDDGIYAYGFFNGTNPAQNAKALVVHKDIVSLSIYANQLIERGKQVFHGVIRELSLVLSGANPGAVIDNVSLAHADGDVEVLEDEAVIYTGLELEHESQVQHETVVQPEEELVHADDGQTMQDVYDSLTQEQKDVVHYMLGAALEEGSTTTTAEHSDTTDEGDLTHQEGNTEMTRNVFEQNGGVVQQGRPTLTREQLTTIVDDAQRMGSLKESFLAHAVEYGIENIDFLFPDAQTIQNSPEFVSRRMEWVSSWLGGTRHSPFSRIKTLSADITHDEARAKGYVKATLKKEEFFALAKRITTPTTIYKKQKLDRDDIVDITDLDVVAWLKAEMRVMLDEEVARAGLVGDGREVDDEDKINETNIRPIAFDDDFYAVHVGIPTATTGDALIDAMMVARPQYRGSGNPTLYCTEDFLTGLLQIKDGQQRRIYSTPSDVAAVLRVSSIQTVDVMEDVATETGDLLGIMVNPSDYTYGADKGGAVAMFDDFDIDYNQYKYLIETRLSGTLTKYRSALVFQRSGATLVTPGVPTFVSGTGVITIPATTGVQYAVNGTNVAAGAQAPISAGTTATVTAAPKAGYEFPHSSDTDWEFTRP
jgi:hypothetical protein